MFRRPLVAAALAAPLLAFAQAASAPAAMAGGAGLLYCFASN